jgi:hypothetical protein
MPEFGTGLDGSRVVTTPRASGIFYCGHSNPLASHPDQSVFANPPLLRGDASRPTASPKNASLQCDRVNAPNVKTNYSSCLLGLKHCDRSIQ